MEQNLEQKIEISSMDLEQLTVWVKETLKQPAFRAKQIYGWLHQRQVKHFSEMTNLSAALRAELDEKALITVCETETHLKSRLDETNKFLFSLGDGNCVETVWMEYHHGPSLCISTQVGCRQGCRFCASTLGGLVRSLTAGEMLGEVYEAQRQMGKPISSLVLMGIGEPLDNFENVMKFLKILSSPEGQNLSLRHVSLSTCGLVPEIRKLMDLKLGLTLSISLHAPDNETRDAIMPVNRRYPIEELMQVCREYFDRTGRRISYEFALIAGVNDSEEQARKLAGLLRGQNCHVNLIPVNPVKERDTHRSSREQVERFRSALERLGINATVRRELGSDISAACGQLRRNRIQAEQDGSGTV